jgi:predicted membrane-bound spermidine synthase
MPCSFDRKLIHSVSVFFSSLIIGAYGVLYIRIFDFLRYVNSIFEAFFVPTLSICLGLLLFKKFKSSHSYLLSILTFIWLLFPLIIYVNIPVLAVSFASIVFILLGHILHTFTYGTNPTRAYSLEICGWLTGTATSYWLMPKIGAESVYFVTIIILLSWKLLFINKKLARIYFIILITTMSAVFYLHDRIDVIRIVDKIPSINPIYNDTNKNETFLLKNSNAKIIETLWTSHDRIDVVQFNNEFSLFYSNQDWSYIPQNSLDKIDPSLNMDKALVIGVGGGGDLVQLERASYRNIVGIEIYAEVVDLMREKYLPGLFNRNTIIVGDARRFLRSTKDKFDLILHSFPDVRTTVTLSGWPVDNSMYSKEFFLESYSRLNDDGIFLSRSFFEYDNPWIVSTIATMRSASEGAHLETSNQFALFEAPHSNANQKRTRYLLALKRGAWTTKDTSRVLAIYPEYFHLDAHTVTNPVQTDLLQISRESPSNWAEKYRSIANIESDHDLSLIRKIRPQQLLFSLLILVGVFIAISIYVYTKKKLHSPQNLMLSLFSGFYYSCLQFTYILNISRFDLSFIQTYIIVTLSLMSASLVFNLFILRRMSTKNIYYIFSPIIAFLMFNLLIYFRTHIEFSFSQSIIALFFVGIFSTVNFNLALRESNNFSLSYSLNLFGYSVGTVAVLILYRNLSTDYLNNLFFIISLYGLISVLIQKIYVKFLA